MIERILVPTDFSDCADQATRFAVKLASKCGAKLSFLTCFQIPVVTTDITYTYDAELVKKFQEDAEVRFQELISRMPEVKEVNYDSNVDLGYPQGVILEKAKTEDFDLVIMGTKGAGGLGGELLGSITSAVIAKCEVPILAIPGNWEEKTIKRIALATDYHDLPHFDKLSALVDLASIMETELHIVNVKTSIGETTFDEAYEARKLDRYLTGIPHLFHSVVGEDLSHSIEEFLTANRIDLLAMLPKEHTFLEKLFLKSETRKAVLHTQTPLLSLRV